MKTLILNFTGKSSCSLILDALVKLGFDPAALTFSRCGKTLREKDLSGKAQQLYRAFPESGIKADPEALSCAFALDQLHIGRLCYEPLPAGPFLPQSEKTLALLEKFAVPVCRTTKSSRLPDPSLILFLGVLGSRATVSGQVAAHVSAGKGADRLSAVLMEEPEGSNAAEDTEYDECVKLETNLDDLTPECAGALCSSLMKEGALDVWTVSANMKKQRPGFILHVLCPVASEGALCRKIFLETGTLGIRTEKISRRILKRDFILIKVKGEKIRVKRAYLGKRMISAKPEYEDCLAASEKLSLPLRKVKELALAASGTEK